MTRLLAFETATPSGGVALLVDGRVVGEFRVQGSQAHSTHCLAVAEQLLKTARLEWRDLDAIAASNGPGAFTGVRVGLTLAKGLAFSLGKPVVVVNTLDAMAVGAWAGEDVELVVPVQDARLGEVYAALFAVESGRLLRQSDDLVVAPEALLQIIGSRKALLCGEGERSYTSAFGGTNLRRARADRLLASPSAVAALALGRLALGETLSAADVEAIYLRDAVKAP